jgi:hypothetical protein
MRTFLLNPSADFTPPSAANVTTDTAMPSGYGLASRRRAPDWL